MQLNFSTYFDENYLFKFLNLKKSLDRFIEDYKFYCLILDDKILENKLLDNKNIIKIKLSDIENFYPELYYAKKNRSRIEYYFTLTPFLQRYLLEKYNLSQLSYLDSDLYFFKSPKIFYEYYMDQKYNILLSPHHNNIIEKKFGKFNVGLIDIRNTKTTLACLRDWSFDCIHCCLDKPHKNKYADQKYLDKWPKNYKHIKIIDKFLINIGPWNVHRINNENFNELIAYHFHGIYFNIKYRYFITSIKNFNIKIDRKIIYRIYKKYLEEYYIQNNFNSKYQNLRFVKLKSKILRLLKLFVSALNGDFFYYK